MAMVQMNVLVPPEVKRTMKLIAFTRGESLSKTVRGILTEHIANSDEEIKEFAQHLNDAEK